MDLSDLITMLYTTREVMLCKLISLCAGNPDHLDFLSDCVATAFLADDITIGAYNRLEAYIFDLLLSCSDNIE